MYGFYSIYAAKKYKPNIWVAGAPPKNLFLKDYYYGGNLFRNFVFYLFRKYFTKKNKKTVKKHINTILAVSRFQKNNIKKIYKREKNVFVVYPPVETKKFYYKEPKDYYLTVSRLEPLKRVDMIIKAFKQLPNKKLIIVGDGSQRKYLEKLAKGCENIKFMGAVYGKKLIELYANCIAFVFMSKQEDFGIVPVEAMAAGKPVITVNEGGPAETVLNKKTGILIEPDLEKLIEAINYMTPEKAKKMKKTCQKRAKLFDSSVYFSKIDKIIKKTIKQFG